MYKFGLEKEMFLLKDEAIKEIPHEIPQDDCGYLAEARSDVFTNIQDAIFNLMSKERDIRKQAEKLGFKITDTPIQTITKDFKIQILRSHTKGIIKYNNLYNFSSHKQRNNEVLAGVHLSITNEKTKFIENAKDFTYNTMFDWVKIFHKLDNEFEKEINDAKRRKGFYEIKTDGRIEYRSLPSNIDLLHLADFINNIEI